MNVFETLLNHCELYFYSQQECSVLFKLSRRGKHKIIIRMRHFKSVFCLKVSLYLIPQIWKKINITGSSLVFSSFENYRTKEMPCSIEIHYTLTPLSYFFARYYSIIQVTMIALCQCARIELCAIEVSLEDAVDTIVTPRNWRTVLHCNLSASNYKLIVLETS